MAALCCVSALLFVLGMVGMIDRPVGIALFVILIGFTYYLYTSAREVEDTAEAEAGVDENRVPGGALVAAMVLLVGIAGVVWGAELMVDGAVALARQWGISEAVIALSLVAIGTSLPELAVSLVAAMRGHAGLAVGNIIGSNISNILLILGVTSMVAPLPISDMMAMRDIPIMIGVACLGFIFMASGAPCRGSKGHQPGSLRGLYGVYFFRLAHCFIGQTPLCALSKSRIHRWVPMKQKLRRR